MSALFTPLEQNIGSVSMNGVTSLELCRIDVRTGATESAVLPVTWTAAIADNVQKLLPFTSASERYSTTFLSLLMEVVDGSGAKTPRLATARDPDTRALVVTLIATASNESALLKVPRTTEAGFLTGGTGSGASTGNIDADARMRIDLLEGRIDDFLSGDFDLSDYVTDTEAADLYALKTHVHDYAASTHNHDGKYLKLEDLPPIPPVPAYLGNTANGVLVVPRAAPSIDFDLLLDAKVPRLKEEVNASLTYSAETNKALVLQSDGTYLPVAVPKPEDLLNKADADDIVDYDVLADGGLVKTDTAATETANAKREFSVSATIPRMANAIAAAQYDATMTKAPALRPDGTFDYVNVATMDKLSAIQSGVDYKEAVVKTFTAIPTDAQVEALSELDRVLVLIQPDTAKVSGVYVVPGTKTWAVMSASRAPDFSETTNVRGAYVFDTETGNSYLCTNAKDVDLPGTHPLTFVTYSKAVSYTFSDGLTTTGTTVKANFPAAGTALLADGGGVSGAVGTATTVARSDHRHPSDPTKADLASPTFTGLPKINYATVPASTDNSTTIATTAWVKSLGLATASSTITDVTASGTTGAIPAGKSYVTYAKDAAGAVSITLYIGNTVSTFAHGGDARFNTAPGTGAGQAGANALAMSNGASWSFLAGPTAAGRVLTAKAGAAAGTFALSWEAPAAGTVTGVDVATANVTALPSAGPLVLDATTNPAVPKITLNVGGFDRAVAPGNDARFNARPAGTADKGKIAYIDAAGVWAALGAGASGQLMTWDAANGLPKWDNYTPTYAAQAPNVVLAGPGTGTATAAPTFRALVPADLPKSTTANAVYAGPSAAAGTDAGFRTLVAADIPSLPASKITAISYDISGSVADSVPTTVGKEVFRFPVARKCTVSPAGAGDLYVSVGTLPPSGSVTLEVVKIVGTATTQLFTILIDGTGVTKTAIGAVAARVLNPGETLVARVATGSGTGVAKDVAFTFMSELTA